MKEIPLTQGKIALVDDWNYDWLSKYKWYADRHRQRYYARTNSIYKGAYMHRLIMKPSTGLEVDHLDKNGLNCQESNMRNCTRSVNAQNQRDKGNYVGVYLDKRDGSIFSSICVNYKTISLGRFTTREEAAIAYNTAALKYFGNNARLNIL
jgi:hypothetical protein